MLEKEIIVASGWDLGARSAARITRIVNQSTSQVWIYKDDGSADGSSILRVIMLAVAQGARLRVTVSGPDEAETMGKLVALFETDSIM